jgi:nitrate/TMAO reductase-like tetraheme cytochrome c subunit
MHETIGFDGCGKCHSKNDNLMSRKDKVDPNRKAALAKRAGEDPSCIPCHDSQGKLKKAAHSGADIPSIMGTLYCPKDKLRFSAGTQLCSKCGGSLLSISAVTERSHRNPSNEICMECHRMEEVQQIKRHTIFNANKLKQCLDCHRGHDDCDSCHH